MKISKIKLFDEYTLANTYCNVSLRDVMLNHNLKCVGLNVDRIKGKLGIKVIVAGNHPSREDK